MNQRRSTRVAQPSRTGLRDDRVRTGSILHGSAVHRAHGVGAKGEAGTLPTCSSRKTNLLVAPSEPTHLDGGLNVLAVPLRPDDRHTGRDIAILENRKVVYEAARKRHPRRWTGSCRKWHADMGGFDRTERCRPKGGRHRTAPNHKQLGSSRR